jgi:site-specific DNA-cytosine methylase
MPRVDRIFLNGLSDRMDESEFGVPRVTFENQDRAARLKAIGNAVVPTIPEIIARAIIEAEGD